METLYYIFFKDEISSIVSVMMICFFLVFMIQVISRFKWKGFDFVFKKSRSVRNEKYVFKVCFWVILIGFTFHVFHCIFSESTSSTIDLSSWEGSWKFSYENETEYCSFKNVEHEIIFQLDEDQLKGKIYYNGRRDATGFISHVRQSDNGGFAIRGKLGRYNGQKEEFEFVMFPNGKSFMGKYRPRNTRDEWKPWIGRKVS